MTNVSYINLPDLLAEFIDGSIVDTTKVEDFLSNELGFQYYFVGYTNDKKNLFNHDIETDIICATNFPVEYQDYYFSRDSFSSDLTIKHAFQYGSPIEWEALRIQDNCDPAGKEIIDVAIDHNLKCGITHSVSDSKNGLAVSSFSKNTFERIDVRKELNVFFCLYTINAMLISQQEKTICGEFDRFLSLRECECLSWVAEGKTSTEISHLLSISEMTVNYHIKNAVKKLGCKNRVHAVAKAIVNKVIFPAL